jgi:hypothetical protein
MSLESPAAGRSFAPRVLVAGEYTALVMTFLALFGCLAALFVYTGNSLSQGAAVRIPEPDLTGKREDNYAQLSYFTTRETYRRQAQEQYRAAVTQAVAYLAGAAVAFLAVGLFLRAARAPLTTPVTVWDRLGQFAPAMVALVCATLIFIFAVVRSSESSAITPPYGYPFAPVPAASSLL